MKKIVLFIGALLGSYSGADAQQLQDPGFENWTVTDTLWNGELIYGSQQWPGGKPTTNSYSGAYAGMVCPYASCGIMSGYMFYGTMNNTRLSFWDGEQPDFTGSGAPIDYKPASISGWFKFPSPDSNDVATGTVILKKYDALSHHSQEVGRGMITFSPTEVYTPFEIAITDLQPGVMPDSIVLYYRSGTGYFWDFENDSLHTGVLYLDEMKPGKIITTAPLASGTPDMPAMNIRFFPNPTTDQLQYFFEIPLEDQYTLIITDSNGKNVYSERTEPGKTHSVDTRSLSAGTYYARIRGKRITYTCETIVVNRL